MGAYDYTDAGLPGMLSGLQNDIEGRWVATEQIEFGYPAFGYVGDDENLYGFYLDVGKIAFDGDFVTSNVVAITVNGTAAAAVTFATSHAATMTAVIAAVNALTGVKAVLDSTDSNGRTILIQTKADTAVVSEAVTGGAGQATGTVTYSTSQVFVGGIVRTNNDYGYYADGDAVNVLTSGLFYADCSSAANSNEAAYVDSAATDIGTFSNAGLELGARYRETISSAGNVLCEVTGQKSLTSYTGLFADV
jgi:hypothetical protein